MQSSIAVEELSQEQRDLWRRVDQLWAQSRSRDPVLIGQALHPRYVGWDMSADLPHNRDAAIQAVTGQAPPLQSYALFPHSVEVYDHMVGVVHYSYSATVQSQAGRVLAVTGKWTEVYLRQSDRWTMVAVSGRPDPDLDHPNVQAAA